MLVNITGNIIYLSLDFTIDNAAAKNMVNIITDQIFRFILTNSLIKPMSFFIESNLSGDKKNFLFILEDKRVY